MSNKSAPFGSASHSKRSSHHEVGKMVQSHGKKSGGGSGKSKGDSPAGSGY